MVHTWVEQVQPALDYLLANEYALYAAVGIPALLLFFGLLSLLFGGKKVCTPRLPPSHPTQFSCSETLDR